MMKKAKHQIRTADERRAASYEMAGPDLAALARTADDLVLELHGFGNELHKAGLHRQGTAADVAAGMVETITEELLNGS